MDPHTAELLELARLADLDKPYVKEQHARLQAAAAEDSLAGELRRMIHRGPMTIGNLERKSGVSLDTIGDFLEGAEISLSDFEKVANALGMKPALVEFAVQQQTPVLTS